MITEIISFLLKKFDGVFASAWERRRKKRLIESSDYLRGLVQMIIKHGEVRTPLRVREMAEIQRLIDADILQILTPDNFRDSGICTFTFTESARKMFNHPQDNNHIE